jgi:DNA-binding NtrC family response regulator
VPDSERILIVEDDRDILVAAKLLLKRHFADVVTATDPAVIPQLVAEAPFDAVLLDMNFGVGERSGREGLDWLSRILELDRDAVVILITAYSAIDTAVEAMKMGAIDFVAKPWQNEKLVATVQAAVRLRRSRLEAARLKDQNQELVAHISGSSEIMLGESQAMREVFRLIAKAAPTEANVLILGENGTGKELVAREIHRQSKRAGGVFMSVDLGAVAETVVPSELFGHKKGAFTGANENRIGRFQAATGGTLFLDELGNIPRHVQAKLLTALERREVVPVGSNAPVPVDVRVISATNVARDDLADEGGFRQDLLYRLNTVEIQLPPLRERADDIPMLAKYFIERFCRDLNKKPLILAPSAVQELCAYSWPGNVRELQNCIERAVILTEGDTIHARHLNLSFRDAVPPAARQEGPWDQIDLSGTLADASRRVLAEVERRKIEQALKDAGGNKGRAADVLQVSYKTFTAKLKDYGLE